MTPKFYWVKAKHGMDGGHHVIATIHMGSEDRDLYLCHPDKVDNLDRVAHLMVWVLNHNAEILHAENS